MFLHSIHAEKFRVRLRHPAPDYSRMSPLRRIALKCQLAKNDIERDTATHTHGHRTSGWQFPDALLSRIRVGATGWTALGLRGGAE